MNIATLWADERGMTWNTKKGKSEVLESKETRDLIFKLAGKRLEQEPEVTYLGVSLSENGITDTNFCRESEAQRTPSTN